MLVVVDVVVFVNALGLLLLLLAWALQPVTIWQQDP